MTRYILLSYGISIDTPLYGDTPAVEIIPKKCIATGDSCNTALVKLINHSGTHADAPKHFWDDGRFIADYDISEFIFHSPLVIDCKKKPGDLIKIKDLGFLENQVQDCDILLFRTGFWQYRGNEIYRLKNPGISPELARYLRMECPRLRAIGLDTISVSSYMHRDLGRETHRILLQPNGYPNGALLLIEDMKFSQFKLDALEQIIIAPLFLENADSAPCMVIGFIKDS